MLNMKIETWLKMAVNWSHRWLFLKITFLTIIVRREIDSFRPYSWPRLWLRLCTGIRCLFELSFFRLSHTRSVKQTLNSTIHRSFLHLWNLCGALWTHEWHGFRGAVMSGCDGGQTDADVTACRWQGGSMTRHRTLRYGGQPWSLTGRHRQEVILIPTSQCWWVLGTPRELALVGEAWGWADL